MHRIAMRDFDRCREWKQSRTSFVQRKKNQTQEPQKKSLKGTRDTSCNKPTYLSLRQTPNKSMSHTVSLQVGFGKPFIHSQSNVRLSIFRGHVIPVSGYFLQTCALEELHSLNKKRSVQIVKVRHEI